MKRAAAWITPCAARFSHFFYRAKLIWRTLNYQQARENYKQARENYLADSWPPLSYKKLFLSLHYFHFSELI